VSDRPESKTVRQSIFENVRSKVIKVGKIVQNSGTLIIIDIDLKLGGQRSEFTPELDPKDIPPEIVSAAERKFWLLVMLLLSGVCTIGTLILREQGILQPYELGAFDYLVRLRPHEKTDPRLLVVAVTESDIQKQKEGSLSDLTLSRVLAKLEKGQPRVIGLDLYRDIPVKEGRQELLSRLKNPKLVATCAGSTRLKKGISAPPGVPRERLGLSDVVVDDDGILRRHLLVMQPDLESLCKTNETLSFQVALHYLAEQGIQPQLTEKEEYRLRNVIFKPLSARRGAYRTGDTRGYQVLLNYRSVKSPELVAQKVTVSDVLEDRVDLSWVKDRVVLIGVSAESVKDDHLTTPYSSQVRPPQRLSGVFVHAQMVSQILSAVLDGRPLLWVLPDWVEVLWIVGWSVVGGVVGMVVRSRWLIGLVGLCAVGALVGLCWMGLLYGGWLPLIPPALVLFVTDVCVALAGQRARSQNQMSSENL
jgi:CHASE2 domain-containing sensor protein